MAAQSVSPQVQQVFEAACALAPDEQSLLLALLQQQILTSPPQQSAKTELIAEVQAARQELAAGQYSSGSVDDFLQALDN
ncbi:MAG: hypothetical protein EA366_08535 [Spirulina sp. DLM2.Bin59]|nr:MAG: hypothetical protein EA366_08535 [Spirulina sp. DLM2.Bin59]